MSPGASSSAAAVPGLARSDPGRPGITRERGGEGFRYRDPSGAEVTQREALQRIGALAIPPAWANVWISPDPWGHIQATGVDSRGRIQYRYHQRWREQRDAQKFLHMLRFASVLPALRAATVEDLGRGGLDRDRVAASAVRLIDLGLFRIGGEKYAELDHHYGATTLEKRHVSVTREGMMFDYIAKGGKRRAITVTDEVVLPTVRALVRWWPGAGPRSRGVPAIGPGRRPLAPVMVGDGALWSPRWRAASPGGSRRRSAGSGTRGWQAPRRPRDHRPRRDTVGWFNRGGGSDGSDQVRSPPGSV